MIVEIQSFMKCSTLTTEKRVDYRYRYHCAFEGHEKKLTLVISLKHSVFLYNFLHTLLRQSGVYYKFSPVI